MFKSLLVFLFICLLNNNHSLKAEKNSLQFFYNFFFPNCVKHYIFLSIYRYMKEVFWNQVCSMKKTSKIKHFPLHSKKKFLS